MFISSVLKCSDAETIAWMRRRIVCMRGGMEYEDELLNIDEAMKSLDASDEKVLQKNKDNVQSRKAALASFNGEYRDRVAKHKAEVEKKEKEEAAKGKKGAGRGRGRGKGGASGSDAPAAAPAPPLNLATIEQSDAKRHMPPGGSLWKSRTDSTWNSRLQPLSKHTATWARYGEEASLRIVVSECWADWCLLNGIDIEQCPMTGLVFRDA